MKYLALLLFAFSIIGCPQKAKEAPTDQTEQPVETAPEAENVNNAATDKAPDYKAQARQDITDDNVEAKADALAREIEADVESE